MGTKKITFKTVTYGLLKMVSQFSVILFGFLFFFSMFFFISTFDLIMRGDEIIKLFFFILFFST